MKLASLLAAGQLVWVGFSGAEGDSEKVVEDKFLPGIDDGEGHISYECSWTPSAECKPMTFDEQMSTCDEADTTGKWDYGFLDENGKFNKGSEHWEEMCEMCKKNHKYSSPIDIVKDTAKSESDFEESYEYILEKIHVSMPYKYGYGYENDSGQSFYVQNENGIKLVVPKEMREIGAEQFKFLGGALHHEQYCLKEVVLHLGKDSSQAAPTPSPTAETTEAPTDAGRRRLGEEKPGLRHNHEGEYIYMSSEHTVNGVQASAEIQFVTYKCGYTWEEAKTKGYVAIFSQLYDIDTNKCTEDDYSKCPYMYNNSLYKIVKYYLKTEGIMECAGNCHRMDKRDLDEEDHHRRRLGDSGASDCRRRRLAGGGEDTGNSADCPPKWMYVDLHELLVTSDDTDCSNTVNCEKTPDEPCCKTEGDYKKYFFYKGGYTRPPCIIKTKKKDGEEYVKDEDGSQVYEYQKVKWHIWKAKKKISLHLIDYFVKHVQGFGPDDDNSEHQRDIKHNFRDIQTWMDGDEIKVPSVYAFKGSFGFAAAPSALIALLTLTVSFLL